MPLERTALLIEHKSGLRFYEQLGKKAKWQTSQVLKII